MRKTSKALFALLLSGCAAGPSEQFAYGPTAVPAEPPVPGEPPAPGEPTPATPEPLAPAPVAPSPTAPQPAAPQPVAPTLVAPTPAPVAPVPGAPAPIGPTPIEKLPGAVWPPPGGWEPPPCEVEASTTLTKRGTTYEVTARLKNRSKKPIEFDAPDRCPQGPAYFHGLGETYDYYGACAAGACASPRPPAHFRVAPGQSITIATIRVEPGGNGCNAPLDPGTYFVSFGISTGHLLCGGPAAHFDRAAPPPKPRAPSSPKKCPPPLACGIACPGGNFARDENGCSTCGCAKAPTVIAPSEPGVPPPSQ